jgi:tight adherence protein B
MNWLRSNLEGAGLAKYSSNAALISMLLLSLLVGALAGSITRISALGLCLSIGTFGFCLESLSLRSRARRRALSAAWPQVLDSLQSAAFSGLPVTEAFSDLAESGPLALRPSFEGAVTRLDSGLPLAEVLDWLKSDVGEHHGDKLFEVIRAATLAGGQGYLESLRAQSAQIRSDLALSGELESKQGWVAGTAKLAVAAPWLIVAMLSSRPENATAYNQSGGIFILFVGFLVCLFAYRLIHIFGALPQRPRVFSKS